MSDSYQSIMKDPNVYLPIACRKYIDPMTGEPVVGDTSIKITKKVEAIRLERGLPIDNIQKDVEEHLCRLIPSWCERKIRGPMIRKEFTKADVLAFIESVKGTILSGGVVEKSLAEDRAQACLQCPYNLSLAGCEGCNGVSNVIFSMLGATRRVKIITQLKSCGICGCSLKAKIWVPKDVLEKTSHIQNTKGEFPAWCWVEKDGK